MNIQHVQMPVLHAGEADDAAVLLSDKTILGGKLLSSRQKAITARRPSKELFLAIITAVYSMDGFEKEFG